MNLRQEAPLVIDTTFTYTINELIGWALKYIDSKYQHNEPEQTLYYHTISHYFVLANRGRRIFDVLEITNPELSTYRHRYLAELLFAYHDLQQLASFSEPVEVEGLTIIKRQPKTGRNEELSAMSLLNIIASIEFKKEKYELLTPEEIALINPSFTATIPEFTPSGVNQPYLLKDSHILTIILALVDLGGGLMDGGGQFVKEGIQLFVENNPYIWSVYKNNKNFTTEQKSFLKEQFIKHLAFQKNFLMNRLANLEHDLAGIPESARDNVRALFNHFPDSMAAIETLEAHCKEIELKDLLLEYGYPVDN